MGETTLDNMPPGKYVIDRQKASSCDRREVVVESGKTVTSEFVRKNGTAVVGKVVGLKEGMYGKDPRNPGAIVSVRPVSERRNPAIDDWPRCDSLICGMDGQFKTEQLLPGEYEIFAEAFVHETPEGSQRMGIRGPSYVGRTTVTVHESGEPPEVTIELKSVKDKPATK
jgi:hypothetical protein